MWITARPCRVETFKVEARCAEVAQFVETGMMLQQAAISSDIVRDELPKERESGGDAGIVSFRILLVLPG